MHAPPPLPATPRPYPLEPLANLIRRRFPNWRPGLKWWGEAFRITLRRPGEFTHDTLIQARAWAVAKVGGGTYELDPVPSNPDMDGALLLFIRDRALAERIHDYVLLGQGEAEDFSLPAMSWIAPYELDVTAMPTAAEVRRNRQSAIASWARRLMYGEVTDETISRLAEALGGNSEVQAKLGAALAERAYATLLASGLSVHGKRSDHPLVVEARIRANGCDIPGLRGTELLDRTEAVIYEAWARELLPSSACRQILQGLVNRLSSRVEENYRSGNGRGIALEAVAACEGSLRTARRHLERVNARTQHTI